MHPKSSDSKSYALCLAAIMMAKRHPRKGDRFTSDNVKLVLLCFSRMEGRYGVQLGFFYPSGKCHLTHCLGSFQMVSDWTQ